MPNHENCHGIKGCKCEELEKVTHWETEYSEFSDDVRQYALQGWQAPIALVGVDITVISLAVITQKRWIEGTAFLFALVLTVLTELEMIKWLIRSKRKTTILKCYACCKHLTRFSEPENLFLRSPLGECLIVFLFAFAGILGYMAIVILG